MEKATLSVQSQRWWVLSGANQIHGHFLGNGVLADGFPALQPTVSVHTRGIQAEEGIQKFTFSKLVLLSSLCADTFSKLGSLSCISTVRWAIFKMLVLHSCAKTNRKAFVATNTYERAQPIDAYYAHCLVCDAFNIFVKCKMSKYLPGF